MRACCALRQKKKKLLRFVPDPVKGASFHRYKRVIPKIDAVESIAARDSRVAR